MDPTQQITEITNQLMEALTALHTLKKQLNGHGTVDSDDESDDAPVRRRRRGKAARKGRAPKMSVTETVDYFKSKGKNPVGAKTMAEDLKITLTTAHKRIKAAKKSLKRVQEGHHVLYMVKPRRSSAAASS